MKVLKKVDCNDWRLKFSCERCTSELEAEPADMRAEYHEGCHDPRDPSPSYYTYHCTCAVCNQQHNVAERDIPKAMQHFLQEKARPNGPQSRH